jgi:hypothetical protein
LFSPKWRHDFWEIIQKRVVGTPGTFSTQMISVDFYTKHPGTTFPALLQNLKGEIPLPFYVQNHHGSMFHNYFKIRVFDASKVQKR